MNRIFSVKVSRRGFERIGSFRLNHFAGVSGQATDAQPPTGSRWKDMLVDPEIFPLMIFVATAGGMGGYVLGSKAYEMILGSDKQGRREMPALSVPTIPDNQKKGAATPEERAKIVRG